MYWVESNDDGVWQVMKGDRVVCILLSRTEAEHLAEALTRLKQAHPRHDSVLSFP